MTGITGLSLFNACQWLLLVWQNGYVLDQLALGVRLLEGKSVCKLMIELPEHANRWGCGKSTVTTRFCMEIIHFQHGNWYKRFVASWKLWRWHDKSHKLRWQCIPRQREIRQFMVKLSLLSNLIHCDSSQCISELPIRASSLRGQLTQFFQLFMLLAELVQLVHS